MRAGTCHGDEMVELYFYEELAADARAEADAHFAVCAACRESLADLRAIEAALAARADAAMPPGGWQPFMHRLDARLDTIPSARPAARYRWMQMAAALTLIAGGAAGGWTLSRFAPSNAPVIATPARPAIDRALTEAGDTGLDRARVVLAGLAQKEDGAEWSLERRMAATLLPEVRLIRQAAADRGRGDLADILIDVETLLLQASYAETDDAETLARLRGMIDRRDVLMRLSVASGGAGAAAPPPIP